MHPCSTPLLRSWPFPSPTAPLTWQGTGRAAECPRRRAQQLQLKEVFRFSKYQALVFHHDLLTTRQLRCRENAGMAELPVTSASFLRATPSGPQNNKKCCKKLISKLKVREGGCRITGSCGITGGSHSLHSTCFCVLELCSHLLTVQNQALLEWENHC